MPDERVIFCFGELLWDCLPRGIFLGGAPFNVAYHLNRLGRRAYPISAVGADFLGEEALRRLQQAGIPSDLLSVVKTKRTGVVQVAITKEAGPAYTIVDDAAWDHIEPWPEVSVFLERCAAVVFGSLAQRSHENLVQLEELLAVIPDDAERVFDVNLRPPSVSPSLLDHLGQRSTLIKLNDDELAQILSIPNERLNLQDGCRRLAERWAADKICVTAGSRGAGLLWNDHWHWSSAEEIAVRDTVGAGDAFLAGFLHKLMTSCAEPETALTFARRLAEFVATQDGATPNYIVAADGAIVGAAAG